MIGSFTTATVRIITASGSYTNVTANPGDWISYVGTSLAGTSPWKKNYCLMWNGSQWVQIDPLDSRYTAHYMEALNDITEGAAEGVFSWVMCRKLMATDAFIKTLEAMDIILNEFNIEGKMRRGSIRSRDYSEGSAGSKINYDGNAEFNNGKFRGHIEADSGTFHGRIEADEGIFKGSIISGPLVLMDETPTSSNIIYNTGTAGRTIVEAEYSRNGIIMKTNGTANNWTFNVSGTYSSNKIIAIRFYAVVSVGSSTPSCNVYVTQENGTEIMIARQDAPFGLNPQNITLSSQLSFAYTSGGKTFKLIDLPTQDPHVKGTIWRSGNQLMIST